VAASEIGSDLQIAFTANEDVRAAIARLGRTEDAQFSPDGRRLVLVGLRRNRLLILDLEIALDAERPRVALTGFLEVASAALRYPHGAAWIDDWTLAIANRAGQITIFALPQGRPPATRVKLEPVRSIGGDDADLVKTPGSISVSPVGMGLFELLVCNNYVHHVTRLLVDQRDNYAVVTSEILLDDGIEVPDGIALSPSGRWIAVSNHGHHNVFLYRNGELLNGAGAPHGVLGGIRYPHGLRFAADEMSLLVADAGTPLVHIFKSEDGDWAGDRDPVKSIPVVSDAVFKRGNYNPQEGGPKGIALGPDDRLMVVSCEEQPLAFFDISGVLGPTEPVRHHLSNASDVERTRETLLRYLSTARAGMQDAAEAIRRSNDLDIEALLGSHSWRITAPLRWVRAKLDAMR